MKKFALLPQLGALCVALLLLVVPSGLRAQASSEAAPPKPSGLDELSQAIIEEKRFEDFAALYRLLHRTRFPQGVNDARDCLLEKYYAYSEEQGGRVRDRRSFD